MNAKGRISAFASFAGYIVLGESRVMLRAMIQKNTRKNNAPIAQSDAEMIDFNRSTSHVRVKW